MNRRAEILEELKSINSLLAVMPVSMPYVVPGEYFQGLAENLVAGVQAFVKDEPGKGAYSELMPFSVPENYFETLAEKLADTAKTTALPSGLKTPYETPDGYLERLPEQLLSTASGKVARTKVISFRPVWKKLAGVAAAAIVVLGIGLGTYGYFHGKAPDVVAARQLSKLDDAAVHGYVMQHLDEFDTEALEVAAANASRQEGHAGVSDLEASDIQEYLQETGEAAPTTNGETL